MKAELITLHSVYNYGSVLQAYATQEIFKKYGVKITILDFVRENNLFKNKLKRSANNSIIKELILLPSLKKQKKVFDKFSKDKLNISKRQYIKEKDFDNFEESSDFYITGSDQVWNSTWNGGIIPPLYLSFIKTKPKFAFSASFGKEKISQEEIEDTIEYINDYKLISVREKSAVDILQKQYNYKKCQQILDPTLLISKDEWKKIESNKNRKKPYILVYQLNSNKKFDKYIKRVSKDSGYEVVRICRRYDQIILYGKSSIIPSVEEFLSLFDNAKMVITDSFHALSFCLNLNVPFICIYPQKFNTRLQSCLEMFDLLDRKVSNYDEINIYKKKIDWDKINSVLEIERKKSKKFIEDCLKIVNKKQ